MISARICVPVPFTTAVLASLGLGGCTKKVGDAVVLKKEHIDALNHDLVRRRIRAADLHT